MSEQVQSALVAMVFDFGSHTDVGERLEKAA